MPSLGKKGTSTDITIYDRKSADTVSTYIVANTYPDKIQPLMQIVNMAQYAILNVAKLDKFLGEQVLALESVGLTQGFVLHSYEVDGAKLRKVLENTSLSKYAFVEDAEKLKQAISSAEPVAGEGRTTIVIDHAFDVKGVGTVVLGTVTRGTVKAYDNLELLPAGKSVLVKSIQMHDDPVESSASPARVGLAIKGASADEISRGDVICEPGAMQAGTGPFDTNFEKSQFFKGDLAENQTYMVSVGLQIKAVRIKAKGSGMELAPEKPLAFAPNQSFVLLKPDSPTTRIIGKGRFN